MISNLEKISNTLAVSSLQFWTCSSFSIDTFHTRTEIEFEIERKLDFGFEFKITVKFIFYSN